MCIIPLTEIRNVTNITVAEKERIYDFLKGALLYWCKNKPEEWFMGRDFLSGKKFDWNGTPLIVKKNLFNRCQTFIFDEGTWENYECCDNPKFKFLYLIYTKDLFGFKK
jgi:hypothetical protein